MILASEQEKEKQQATKYLLTPIQRELIITTTHLAIMELVIQLSR